MRKIFFTLSALFISLSTINAQYTGSDFFTSPIIHTVYLNFAQTGFWDSLTVNFTNDQYMLCNAIVDGNMMNQIGVKFKGNSSYNNPGIKKPFKLDFNYYVSGQNYLGLKKINLNNSFKDPTFLREKVMLDFLQMENIPAPRCTYANLYINNVFWGLYTAVEEVDETFLDDRFGNKDGNLFKGDPQGNLSWMGSTASSYYNNYELHTNQTVTDWSDLVDFINILNNTPSSSLHDSLETILNTGNWVRAWAANILVANLDSYQGSGHNYFIYHNSATDKFEWITWDVNEAFGNFQMGITVQQIKDLTYNYIPSPSNMRPLENNMLLNATYTTDYADALYDLLSTGFDTTTLYPLIDSLADWIRSDVYADPNKFYTNQNFEDNITMDITLNPFVVPGLKPFIATRIANIQADLTALGYPAVGIPILSSSSNSFSVHPNPVHDYLNVKSNSSTSAVSISVFDLTGRNLFQSSLNQNAVLDFSSYPSGMYFVTIDGSAFKIVKQ